MCSIPNSQNISASPQYCMKLFNNILKNKHSELKILQFLSDIVQVMPATEVSHVTKLKWTVTDLKQQMDVVGSAVLIVMHCDATSMLETCQLFRRTWCLLLQGFTLRNSNFLHNTGTYLSHCMATVAYRGRVFNTPSSPL